MRQLLTLIGYLGLALTIVPAILVFAGSLEMEQHKWLMLIGLILWFGSAILKRKR